MWRTWTFLDFKLVGVQNCYLINNLGDYALLVHEHDEKEYDLFLLMRGRAVLSVVLK